MTIQSISERLPRRAFLGAGFVTVFLSVVGCESALIAAANSAELTEYEVVGDRLFVNGTINSKSLNQFNTIYAENPQITTLVEQEIDGSVDDDTMIALAYRIRELGLNTHLEVDSEIYSGGVDLFLAGVERTMERGAVVGVHSWSDGERDAADYPRSSPEHEQNRRYIEDMLGADDFYWFTIYAAPADGMYKMTNNEIIQYGLLTQPIR